MKKSMKLKRMIAGILTALMIFEPGMEALAGDTPGFEGGNETVVSEDEISVSENETTVSENEPAVSENETAVSENEATVSENEAAVSENEAAVSENEASASENTASENAAAEYVAGFNLYPSALMYGEDGSNADGNLDAVFNPVLFIDDELYDLYDVTDGSGDYIVRYKFVSANEAESIDTVSVNNAEDFDALDGIVLDTVNAGTDLYAVTLLEPVSDKAIAKITKDIVSVNSITIAKRKISLRFEADPDFKLDSKAVSDNGLYTVSENASECGSFVIESMEGSMTKEALENANRILSASENNADMVFDLSGIEVDEDAWMEIPMEYIPDPEFDENFEIVGNIFGNVYTLKAHYYITFRAQNNGQSKILTYEIPKGSAPVTIPAFLSSIGALETVNTMDGLILPDSDCAITGWTMRIDGMDREYRLNHDFSDTSQSQYQVLNPGTDYYLGAEIAKLLADGMYVSIETNVYYSARAHVLSEGQGSSDKKKVADIDLYIYTRDHKRLIAGKDFTVTYKNNTNASMRLDEEGVYQPLYTDNSRRPLISIKGKGVYKGFSADVYFEILPQNLSGSEYYYYTDTKISGLSNSYYIDTKGKLSKKVDIKVTNTYYYYKSKQKKYKVQLKEKKDYIPSLYRWNDEGYWEEQSFSDPNMISRAGDYLYMIRGTGNYCGGVYSAAENGLFNDGKENGYANPAHEDFDGSYIPDSYQFRVTNGDDYWNLERAEIKIKKRSIRFDGKYHDASSFGVSVSIGKGKNKVKLIEGVHYRINYTSAEYSYRYTDKNNNIWVGRKSDHLQTGDTFRKANRYDFTISAIEGSGYFGVKKSKKSLKISGIRLRPNYFTIDRSSLDYLDSNSHPRMMLTLAGVRAGLTSNSGSNYAVGFYYDSYNMTPGKHYCGIYALGDGVDHERNIVRYWKRGRMSIQGAIKRGIIGVSFDDGYYNAGGALPETITITYPKCTYNSSTLKYTYEKTTYTVHPEYNDYKVDIQIALGNTYSATYKTQKLTFHFSNNKKAGAGAKVIIKGSGVFGGKAKKNASGAKLGYSVIPYVIGNDTMIPAIDDSFYLYLNGKKTGYIHALRGNIYAVLCEDEKGKKGATLDRPKVKLYQGYYKNVSDRDNNRVSLAPLKPDQYKAVAGRKYDENAVEILLEQNGNPLISGIEIGENVRVNGYYALYDSKATIESAVITYNDSEYTISAKDIPDIVYAGSPIWPSVVSVRLSDGTELTADDVRLYYNYNVTSGKKKGSITIKLAYNVKNGTFKYGGSQTFKFNITEAPKVTL